MVVIEGMNLSGHPWIINEISVTRYPKLVLVVDMVVDSKLTLDFLIFSITVHMAFFTNGCFLQPLMHFIYIFQLWIFPLRLLQQENLLSMADAWFQLQITLELSCTPKTSFSN